MTNPTSTDRVRGDCRLIAQTLRKLSTPRILLRLVVIVAAAILWLWVSSLLLGFGRTLTYESFASLGQQIIDTLVLINPYLWWGVVVLWTLIVFFSVRAWFNGNVEAGRAEPVELHSFRKLCTELSPETRDVMRWSWLNHDEPFTIGDLRRTLEETRHGRIDKIAIVREQEAILKPSWSEASATQAGVTAPAAPPVLVPAAHAASTAPAVEASPAARATPAAPAAPAVPVAPATRQAPTVGHAPASVRTEPEMRIAGETRGTHEPRRPIEPHLPNE